jgi:hypothetical protein
MWGVDAMAGLRINATLTLRRGKMAILKAKYRTFSEISLAHFLAQKLH